MPLRLDGRSAHEIRPLHFTRQWIPTVAGSVLVDCGLTRVLCTAVITEGVPPFLRNTDEGWLTAEYAMVPAATSQRKPRDRNGRVDGRSVEIQRLIGRALRAVLDRKGLIELDRRHHWVGCEEAGNRHVIRASALDGLLKYGRVRGHAAHSVRCHEVRQPAASQEIALDKIQPHRLSLFIPESL